MHHAQYRQSDQPADGQARGRSLFHLATGALGGCGTSRFATAGAWLLSSDPASGVLLRRCRGRGRRTLRWSVGAGDHRVGVAQRRRLVQQIQAAKLRRITASPVEDAVGGHAGFSQVSPACRSSGLLVATGTAGLSGFGTSLPSTGAGRRVAGRATHDERTVAAHIPGVRLAGAAERLWPGHPRYSNEQPSKSGVGPAAVPHTVATPEPLADAGAHRLIAAVPGC